MFRKLAIAVFAIGTAATLAPTAASAHWYGHRHHGHGHGYRHAYTYATPSYYVAPSCYTIKRVVYTAYGPEVRRVRYCG